MLSSRGFLKEKKKGQAITTESCTGFLIFFLNRLDFYVALFLCFFLCAAFLGVLLPLISLFPYVSTTRKVLSSLARLKSSKELPASHFLTVSSVSPSIFPFITFSLCHLKSVRLTRYVRSLNTQRRDPEKRSCLRKIENPGFSRYGFYL